MAKSCKKNSLQKRPSRTGIHGNKMCKKIGATCSLLRHRSFQEGCSDWGLFLMFEIQQIDLLAFRLCTLLLMSVVWPSSTCKLCILSSVYGLFHTTYLFGIYNIVKNPQHAFLRRGSKAVGPM